jgi:glucose-6-phosphate 1-dehydrogenase
MAHTVVIFGASGDLTSRKLIPALYSLFQKKRLPENTRIVGSARTEFSHEQWREALAETTAKFTGKDFDPAAWQEFAELIYYHPVDIGQAKDFQGLAKFLNELESGAETTRVYYLSTSPKLYAQAVEQLGAAGLASQEQGPRRVVIEKPFGVDLESAQALNADVHRVFQEEQVYRIDHYLGKETVLNLLVLRFANSIFEPIWNRHYINHVQITVAEEVTVGRRAGYYDGAGILRDMFQNHLLQLMTITAMEAPIRYESVFVRDEKVKILEAVRRLEPEDVTRDTRRGQYKGYCEEPDVPPNSQTATWAALKLHVDTWRWKGVPFYLRSGKAMSCRTTQIVVQFRDAPHVLFAPDAVHGVGANRLVIQVQPAEGIQLQLQTKVPDQGMRLRLTDLDFSFLREYRGTMPDSYQRLLLDALLGDSSLFARSDEVEAAWKIIDPINEAWKTAAAPPLEIYEPGIWGPESSTRWMEEQHREWFDVCPVLH